MKISRGDLVNDVLIRIFPVLTICDVTKEGNDKESLNKTFIRFIRYSDFNLTKI